MSNLSEKYPIGSRWTTDNGRVVHVVYGHHDGLIETVVTATRTDGYSVGDLLDWTEKYLQPYVEPVEIEPFTRYGYVNLAIGQLDTDGWTSSGPGLGWFKYGIDEDGNWFAGWCE